MHQHAEYSQLTEEIAAERRSHRQTWSDAAALRQRHSEMAERADRSQQELASRLAGKAAEMAQTEVRNSTNLSLNVFHDYDDSFLILNLRLYRSGT